MGMIGNTVTESYQIFMSSSCFSQTPQYHICPFFIYMTKSALLDTQCCNSCGEVSLSHFETMNSLHFGLYGYCFLQLVTVKMFLSERNLSLQISKECILKYANITKEDIMAGSSIAQMEKDYSYTTSIRFTVN